MPQLANTSKLLLKNCSLPYFSARHTLISNYEEMHCTHLTTSRKKIIVSGRKSPRFHDDRCSLPTGAPSRCSMSTLTAAHVQRQNSSRFESESAKKTTVSPSAVIVTCRSPSRLGATRRKSHTKTAQLRAKVSGEMLNSCALSMAVMSVTFAKLDRRAKYGWR